jgi:hypothetical protein
MSRLNNIIDEFQPHQREDIILHEPLFPYVHLSEDISIFFNAALSQDRIDRAFSYLPNTNILMVCENIDVASIIISGQLTIKVINDYSFTSNNCMINNVDVFVIGNVDFSEVDTIGESTISVDHPHI